MGSWFRPVSGAVEVDFEWREPYSSVLRQPFAQEPRQSRVIFHECVHYWQQLGQGYMAKLAEEDWLRLLRFEREKKLEGPGPIRCEFVARNAHAGFSAMDLQESLARYWDVHVMGPHQLLELEFEDPKRAIDEQFKATYYELKKQGKIVDAIRGYTSLAFDLAMQASAGNYAAPYQFVRERCDTTLTNVVFPLAGHFALQSSKPVEVFLTIVAYARQAITDLPQKESIHDLWRGYYLTVRMLAADSMASAQAECFDSGAYQIQAGMLMQHPVYGRSFGDFDRGREALEDNSFTLDLTKSVREISTHLRSRLALDLCLACPGHTVHRSFLIEWLAPPCVLFADGRHWMLNEFYRRELVPELDRMELEQSAERRMAAEEAMGLNERWLTFRRAARGY